MARTDLEQLVVQLDANFQKFQNKMLKAQGVANQSAGRIEQRFKTMNRSVSASFDAIKGFGAGLVGGLGVEQLARAAATAIKSIADIGDNAKKLGLSTDEFQQLSYVAMLFGFEVEALASGMKKLGVNTSDASRGQGEFGAILKANGVSITNANGELKSQVEILGIVADLVKNAANEQDGLAIAQAALGKSGTELMALLQDGAQGVENAMRQAAQSGTAFTEEQIAKAAQFDEVIDGLIKKISFGLKEAFLDVATDGANAFDLLSAKAAETGSFLQEIVRISGEVDKFVQDYGPFSSRAQQAYGIFNGGQTVRREGKGGLPQLPKPTTIKGVSRDGRATVVPNETANRAADAAAKRDAEEAKRRREQIQGVISDLRFEGDQLKRNELQQAINTALRRAEVEATSAQGRSIAALVTANHQLEESQKAQKENTEANKKAEDELIQIRIAAAEDARQTQLDLIQEQRDGLMSLAEMGYSAFEAWATGSMKAKDAVRSLALQLAQATAQAALFGQGPLAGLFGGSDAGGLFGGLFKNLFGGGASASIYHSGGIVGQGGPSRNVSPAMFANAPRYHNGGIAGLKPGEIPAILQRGEMVIPRGGMTGGGQTPKITYQINNYSKSEVKPHADGGGFDIIDAVSNVIASGGADKAMRRFNVTPGRIVR